MFKGMELHTPPMILPSLPSRFFSFGGEGNSLKKDDIYESTSSIKTRSLHYSHLDYFDSPRYIKHFLCQNLTHVQDTSETFRGI